MRACVRACARVCVRISWYFMMHSDDYNERGHFFRFYLHSWGQQSIFVKINFFVFYRDFAFLNI